MIFNKTDNKQKEDHIVSRKNHLLPFVIWAYYLMKVERIHSKKQ